MAANLVRLLPSPSGLFSSTGFALKNYYREKIGLRDPFVLTPVSSHFALTQLKSLNPKKAVGLDDLP